MRVEICGKRAQLSNQRGMQRRVCGIVIFPDKIQSLPCSEPAKRNRGTTGYAVEQTGKACRDERRWKDTIRFAPLCGVAYSVRFRMMTFATREQYFA